MLEPVRLSLVTFQPEKCYPPYLNTPRSLEACRMNGINPVELVLIPYAEFQKDFPSDPDAAQRRFERIEGARIRTLAAVTKDWKKLCDSEWAPPEKRTVKPKESIIQVPAQVHCTLLELQAAKFRKIEQDNWEELQRTLKMEIIRADNDLKNQKIIQRQSDMQEVKSHLKLEHKLHLELLEHDHIRAMVRAEEERKQKIKEAQIKFNAEQAIIYETHKRNAHHDRLMEEKRQQDRVSKQEYTRQLKDSIMTRIDRRYQERRQSSELKTKFNEERINQFLVDRARERGQQKSAVDAKLDAVREERNRRVHQDRQSMLDSINENQQRQKAKDDENERQRQEQLKASDNDMFEKMVRIRESTQQMVQQKSENTLNQLRYRDDLAKQELEKVRDAQERRCRIKAIRREAYEIAAFRQQKAEEYRRAKLAQDMKDKEDRIAAIKKGFFALDHMRNSMKDIMEKTNTELKNEFNRLRHVGEFSPNKVVQSALAVSDQVLFPRLQRTFGILEEEDDGSKNRGNAATRLFLAGGGNEADMTAVAAQDSAELPLFEGDRTIPALTTRGGRPRTGGRSSSSTALKREEIATLPVKFVTQDHLKTTLMQSMRVIETLNAKHEEMERNRRSRSRSPGGGKKNAHRNRRYRSGPTSPGRYGADSDAENDDVDDYYYGDGGENGEGSPPPPPILRLQGEDGGFEDNDNSYSHQAQASSSAFGNNNSKNKNKGNGNAERLRPLPRSGDNVPDPKLPMYPFTAGQEFADNYQSPTAGGPSPKVRGKSQGGGGGRDTAKSREDPLRTDKNDRAKYLAPPAGRFRKEFSLDHPYAPKGKGRYRGELKQGLKPASMDAKDLAGPGRPLPKVRNADIQATLALAEKVEKLTYDAQIGTGSDAEQEAESLKVELDKLLLVVIEEERVAEEEREEAIRNIVDPAEKARMENIFAEERVRASERLINATKEHDRAIKTALLKTMNLGPALQS